MSCMDRDFRDLGPCTTMGLSQNGNLAMLASKDHLALLNLQGCNGQDQLDVAPVLKEPQVYKFKVEEIQFSFGQESLCAIAHHERLDLVDWADSGSRFVRLCSARGHARNITDLSWHEQDHDLVATRYVGATYIL